MSVSNRMARGQKTPDAATRLAWDAAPPDHLKFYQDHRAEIGKLQEMVVDAMN
jgi:hypothetical protein